MATGSPPRATGWPPRRMPAPEPEPGPYRCEPCGLSFPYSERYVHHLHLFHDGPAPRHDIEAPER